MLSPKLSACHGLSAFHGGSHGKLVDILRAPSHLGSSRGCYLDSLSKLNHLPILGLSCLYALSVPNCGRIKPDHSCWVSPEALKKLRPTLQMVNRRTYIIVCHHHYHFCMNEAANSMARLHSPANIVLTNGNVMVVESSSAKPACHHHHKRRHSLRVWPSTPAHHRPLSLRNLAPKFRTEEVLRHHSKHCTRPRQHKLADIGANLA